MVGPGAPGVQSGSKRTGSRASHRPFERLLRAEEAAEAAEEIPERVSGLGHKPLSGSRNPLGNDNNKGGKEELQTPQQVESCPQISFLCLV